MENDISISKSPEELLRILGVACRTCGQVDQIQLYCHDGSPKETTCFIDMKGDLNKAALCIKGYRMGNSSLYKSLTLPCDFRCTARPAGELLSTGCSLCRSMGSKVAGDA